MDKTEKKQNETFMFKFFNTISTLICILFLIGFYGFVVFLPGIPKENSNALELWYFYSSLTFCLPYFLMLFSKLTKKEVIAAIAFNCSIVLSCVGGLFLILNVFSNTSDPIGQGLVIVILIPVTVMFIGAHRLLMVSFGRLINL